MSVDKRKKTAAQNKEALLCALEKSLGVVTSACLKANVSRKTFYNYIDRDDNFKVAVDDIQNIAIDFVESKLYENINTGNVASTIFYLKTKGKDRGYTERTEVENTHKIEHITIKPYELEDGEE